jgi:hypothetical protein
MSDSVRLEFVQRCPDCGGFSMVLASIREGQAVCIGWDHGEGYVPAESVSRRAVRFAQRFAVDPTLDLPIGWRRVVGGAFSVPGLQ